jgi:rhodanese-related sulfurtransferase/DNA-binding transcriptional ArsR family regulator
MKDVKGSLFANFARIGQALANPKRVELLDLLAQGARSVETLAGLAGMTVANTSAQLKILRQAGMVESERRGKNVIYRLSGDEVVSLVIALRETALARLADVRQLVHDNFEALDDMEPVGRTELLERAKRNEVVVVDVRPPEEFHAGHVPGALSIPMDELEARIVELPRDREIVAYCRGPFCVLAPKAVAMLRAHGLRARRLEDGLPEWRLSGLPTDADAPGEVGSSG